MAKKVYQQLKDVELKYNLYEVSKEEALKLAKPLINQYNEVSRKLADKHNQRPTILKANRFAFGR